MSRILPEIAAGLFLGAFFGLVALGYSMVYGILKLINFAHGDFYMVAAYVSYTILGAVVVGHHTGWMTLTWVGLATMLAAGLLAVGAEKAVYSRMRGTPILSLMIAALGISEVLENGVLNLPFWGASYRTYPVSAPATGFSLAGGHYTFTQLAIVVCALVLTGIVYWIVQRTLLGKAMRAIAEDRVAASLMGINVDRVIAIVFFIGGALAGAGAIMAGLYYGQINYLMGFTIGLQAFTAAVLGGIGNILGAVVGGFVLGILQSIGTGYLGSQWALVFSFGALVAMLWLRPTGLLGERIGRRM
ncbi:MAG: branched-chain amino acid ABC transporter permease [Acidimicrobiales bacterium]